MNDVVIRAEGLGKKYVIGHQASARMTTLRDAISRNFANFARTTGEMLRGRPIIAGDDVEDFWALQDVNFDIQRGDVVGIVGRNGAGKSTLLKILSRITEPTEGSVSIRGRVASLLEVGTGFHPELTGRENIYLNGAILGMGRAEIRRKFDEIVAFSGIEKFLDTPVKRYSSGMHVRLAFAVAAHLEPDVLIVDEVLAVGDAEFQKKCLGRMQDVAGEGRTVLFVSHNQAALASITRTGLLLEGGRLTTAGTIESVLKTYLSGRGLGESSYRPLAPPVDRPHIAFIELDTGSDAPVLESGGTLKIRFEVRFPEYTPRPCLSFQICDSREMPIVHEFIYSPDFDAAEKGVIMATCEFPSLSLNVGDYYLRTFLSEPPGGEVWETLENVCDFQVVRTGSNPYWGWRSDACAYFVPCHWRLERNQDGGL